MLASAATSLLLYLTIPVAAALGLLSYLQLLVVAVCAGTAAVFFQTAYTAYLPSLVAGADRAEGNAKLQGSAQAAQIVGLGSGGAIAQLFGPVNSLLANTATFLISLLSTGAIKQREVLPPASERRRQTLISEVGEGLRIVTRDRWLRTFLLNGAIANLALTGGQAIQVVFLLNRVGLPENALGALIGASSTGGIVGALVARRVGAAIGTARAVLLFQLGLPTLMLLIPLTGPGAGMFYYLVGGAAVSAGVVAGNVLRATFTQSYVPAELLGRIAASGSFLNYSLMPLGALLGGALATWLGILPAMWLTCAGVPLAALILWFSPLRRCRDLPTASVIRAAAR